MELHDLRPNKGAKKKRKRVGRGIAAGQGKTAGRGTKGQNARSGGGKGIYFEGGQLPLARRLPYKRGFTNINKIVYRPINVGHLAYFESGMTVDPEVFVAVGLIKKETDPVVILGDGELDVALTVKAHRFSAAAKEKIEAAGGKVELIALDQKIVKE
jgi:large subunit ribosomal protein L15